MSLKGKLVFDTSNLSDSDSVGSYLRASDGSLITQTTISAKKGLDVNIINATDFDIRDLTHVSDSVKVGDGTDFLAVNNDGSVNVTDNGDSLTVDAVDLDIRNLDYSQDNVALKGSTGNQLVVNSDGSLNVNADISVVNGSDKAEDVASASGDIGTYVLSVRQDALSGSTNTDGDYQSFKTDSLGRLYVNLSAQSAANGSVSVVNTATPIVGSALGNRRKIMIQNHDTRSIWIGSNSSVTTSNGTRLDPGSSVEMEVGPGINIHGITSSSAADIRYFETGN